MLSFSLKNLIYIIIVFLSMSTIKASDENMGKLMENYEIDLLEKKIFLGMNFPNYNHPARLYDEIDLNKFEKIKLKSYERSYYVGYFKGNQLLKFEKYMNNEKTMDFNYLYDENGKLIEYIKNLPKIASGSK